MEKNRIEFIRKQAMTTLELTKGFTPEQRKAAGNAFHTMEELAGYILELTSVIPIGAVWEKANERLPKEAGPITWRWLDKEAAYSGFNGTAFIYDKGGAQVDMLYAIEIEWLDESGEKDDWISVEYRLPEESGRYWCYVQHLTDLGFSYFQWNCDYNAQLQRFSDMTLKDGEKITHWRPLPSPPKSQTNGLNITI
jgi:hypothetical protein